MNYTIRIQRIVPQKGEKDYFGEMRIRDREECVFEATLSEAEVIELMSIGYHLKEQFERSA